MTRRSDGRWVETITLPNGKRKYFYGRSKTEVNIKINNYNRQEADVPTFREVAEEYRAEYAHTHTLSRCVQTDASFRRAIERFGSMPIDKIEPIDIKLFLEQQKNDGFSKGTIILQKTIVNQIFNYEMLKRNASIRTNPVTSVPIPNAPRGKVHSATPEQERVIRQEVNLPFGLFPFLLLYTGCRSGEARALQWRDIDFDNNTISVSKACSEGSGKTEVKTTKTESGVRIIPLLKPLREELLRIPQRFPSHYLFGGKNPLAGHTVKRKWSKYCRLAGLEGLRLHQLRHSFATMCLEAEISPEDAQKLLGHADIKTTVNVYADIRATKQKAAHDKLDKFVSSHSFLQ